jgi:Tol biopolymer transport system component
MKLPNLASIRNTIAPALTALAACVSLSAQAQSANAGAKPSGGGSIPPPGTYAGRIVYTAKGILHIFNLATNGDTNLRVSGVNPKFSRDGTRIVYQNSGIWIMNSDGTSQKQLSSTGGVPSFDPTGSYIAYGDNGVWTMNADGSNKTQLTLSGQQPSYSSDGTQIAYNAGVSGAGQQLFVMYANGTGARQVLTSSAIIDTVWAPGAKVVMGMLSGRNYQLSTYDPNVSGSLMTLTSNSGTNYEPSWSPDASHISWTSTGGIWIMNADGSNPAPVISGGRQGSWGP